MLENKDRIVKISLAEPVTALRHVAIKECCEPLVDFLAHCSGLNLDNPRFRYRRETLLRRSVAEKLCAANRNLPPGYRLAVVEGWRAPHIQRRMYLSTWNFFAAQHPDWSEVQLRRTVNRFTAPLNGRVPPPHTTGGALDVMLADSSGTVLDHCSPYEPFDSKCFPTNAPGLSDTARRTRDILGEALLSTGLTNYPSEYWHWSYGDQGWAYRGGHPNALYDRITPDEFVPDPADVNELPLERIDENF